MTDIVERIRNRIHDAPLPTEYLLDDAADLIVSLRAELARCGESLDKCHAQLMRANSPVVDCRNSNEGERFRSAECGGFQGNGD